MITKTDGRFSVQIMLYVISENVQSRCCIYLIWMLTVIVLGRFENLDFLVSRHFCFLWNLLITSGLSFTDVDSDLTSQCSRSAGEIYRFSKFFVDLNRRFASKIVVRHPHCGPVYGSYPLVWCISAFNIAIW